MMGHISHFMVTIIKILVCIIPIKKCEYGRMCSKNLNTHFNQKKILDKKVYRSNHKFVT